MTSITSEPSIIDSGPLLLAGLRIALDENASDTIPLLWQKFLTQRPTIQHSIDNINYGGCMMAEQNSGNFYYLAACSVWDFADLPQALSCVTIPAQTYAVFKHLAPVIRIKETIDIAFEWLNGARFSHPKRPHDSLHFFEVYNDEFDPLTGTGGMEIWLPITTNNES